MNPTFLSVIMVIFILLGVYNVFSGLRRIREARERGQYIRWYRQINLLTGIEYLLLSFVFMGSLNLHNPAFPAFLRPFVVPFYLIVLLSSAVIAGFVIRQAILNARLLRQHPTAQVNRNNVITVSASQNREGKTSQTVTTEQKAVQIHQRRERRSKAAAARRRHAGRS